MSYDIDFSGNFFFFFLFLIHLDFVELVCNPIALLSFICCSNSDS